MLPSESIGEKTSRMKRFFSTMAALGGKSHHSFAGGRRLTTSPTYETAILEASDGVSEDALGYSVSMEGNFVVVGAFDANQQTGAAYVYETTDGGESWSQKQKLIGSDSRSVDQFGICVGMSGFRIVVGAVNDDDDGINSGSAFVFESVNGGATWFQTAKLTAEDAAAHDRFGFSCGIDGDIIVIGAIQDDIDGVENAGSAYIFRTLDNGASWDQVTKLRAFDFAKDNEFGISVAIHRSNVVVGSMFSDDAGADSGCAYVYRTTDGGTTWDFIQKLVADDAAPGDWFAVRVAIYENTIVVGASNEDSFRGAAYVFVSDDGGASWSQSQKLLASDGANGDNFGRSVAIHDSLIVVGAEQQSISREGKAYVYENDGSGSWSQFAMLAASDGVNDDLFGVAVSLYRRAVVVCAIAKNNFQGAAYTYVLSTPPPTTYLPSTPPTSWPTLPPTPTLTPTVSLPLPASSPSRVPTPRPSQNPTTTLPTGNTTTTAPHGTSSGGGNKKNNGRRPLIGKILGGAAGGFIALIGLIYVAIQAYRARQQAKKKQGTFCELWLQNVRVNCCLAGCCCHHANMQITTTNDETKEVELPPPTTGSNGGSPEDTGASPHIVLHINTMNLVVPPHADAVDTPVADVLYQKPSVVQEDEL